MKELSIEERARRYDEAIKVAQRFYNNSVAVTKKGLEDIFPELNEDEKIRKALIEAIRNNYVLTGSINHIPTKDILAWLEKQGEHAKFINSIQVGDKVTRNQDGVLVNLSQLKRVAKPAEEQGEQKQELLTKEKALKNSPFVEQKSAEWSEDNQSNFYELRSFIVETYRAEDASKLITWLESLKDRVQPQPKQEWSEEDAKALNRISTILVDASKVKNWWKEYRLIERDEMIRLTDFLKSLRPQSTWKPSDEQMKALDDVISSREIKYDILSNLWQDLKKLKEK